MVRVITTSDNTTTVAIPDAVRTFVAPIPYDSLCFSSRTHAVEGCCSLCDRAAVTMVRGGRTSYLAICDVHDRHHRWVRDRQRHGWWYLPPPLQNGGGGWWYLKFHASGLAGGNAGWYLHELSGRRVVDTYARTLHIARSTAERILPALEVRPSQDF